MAEQAKQARTRIAVIPVSEAYRTALSETLAGHPEVELVFADSMETLAEALRGADAVILSSDRYDERVARLIVAQGPQLRWLHSMAAGNEAIIERGVPAYMVATKSGGHHAGAVAEHAVALLLALARGLPTAFENQRLHRWAFEEAGTTRSLIERCAVVLGLGPIGEGIAKRLRAMDMRVIGVSRQGRPDPAVDRCYPVRELHSALAQASVLMVAAPGGPDTEKLIGAAELAALQPGAFLVNIGRGTVIDTAAIEAALRDGTIAGAGLDVIDPEPLPSDHSLWTAPNLIVTPHRAGGGDPRAPYRFAESVLHNLAKFRRGEPLDHVIETRTLA